MPSCLCGAGMQCIVSRHVEIMLELCAGGLGQLVQGCIWGGWLGCQSPGAAGAGESPAETRTSSSMMNALTKLECQWRCS